MVEKLDYRQDGQGFTADAVQHLFVVPADGGTPRQITTGEWSAAAAEWTPDGKSLVYGAGPRVPDAEYEWRESDVYAVDVATGHDQAPHDANRAPTANPAISPNGRLIAYTGYDKNDDTWIDSKLYVMNSDGSGSKLLLDMDRSPQGLTWAADNSGDLLHGAERRVAEPPLRLGRPARRERSPTASTCSRSPTFMPTAWRSARSRRRSIRPTSSRST